MITGGCYCGRVRYEAQGPAFHETICHCLSCRRMVGAPVVAWFSVRRAGLRFTAAEPVSFRSSPGVERQFCGTCGTSLSFAEDRLPDEIDLTIASLDDPAALPPRDHSQFAGRLPWVQVCDGLPAFAERRPQSGGEGDVLRAG